MLKFNLKITMYFKIKDPSSNYFIVKIIVFFTLCGAFKLIKRFSCNKLNANV